MKDTLALAQALALLDNGPDPLLLFDAEDRVVAGNAALRELLGAQAGKLIGCTVAELAGSPLQPLLVASGSFTFLGADQRHGYFHAQDLRLPPGARAVRARLLRDITDSEHLHAEIERLQAELQAQALHDPLTGLLNRRGLMIALEPQVSRCRRYNSPLSLVVMDVYAENAADGLLVRISQLLKDQLRWADVIGCSENHAFIMVLPETRRDDALVLTEKLHELLTREFPAPAAVWVAFGVVEWQKTDNANTLLRRAHTALDQAHAARDGRSAVAL